MDQGVQREPHVFDRTLRLIEWLGWVSLGLYLLALVGVGVLWPDPYGNVGYVTRLLGGNLFIGRAYNISQGIAWGFNNPYLMFQCGWQDIIILLIMYPWLVAGYRRVVEWRFIGPQVRQIRDAAQRHKGFVAKYGPPGLILFVLFPFWSTGPLVGGVVGYLLGMRTRLVFASVILGNFASVALWIYLLDQLMGVSEHMGRWLPLGIVVAVLSGAAYLQIRSLRKRARRMEEQDL